MIRDSLAAQLSLVRKADVLADDGRQWSVRLMSQAGLHSKIVGWFWHFRDLAALQHLQVARILQSRQRGPIRDGIISLLYPLEALLWLWCDRRFVGLQLRLLRCLFLTVWLLL